MGDLQVRRNDGIVWLTLDNPDRKNAIDTTMWRRLEGELASVAESPSDRAVVLAGAGDDFCSGADIGGGERPTHRTQLERMQWFNRIVLALHDLRVPTIARVDGVATGIGMNLALACDLIVASDRARFAEVFIKRALSVDGGGSWLLPRRVGVAKAKELCLFGDVISAPEAAAIGLVNRVTAPSDLDEAVGDWARRLADGPITATAQTKRLLNHAHAASLDVCLESEARAQCLNIADADFREAMTAFRERRAPLFSAGGNGDA